MEDERRELGEARRLKIALVHAADFGGGAERSVLTLHRSLISQGHYSHLHVGYKLTDEREVTEIARIRPIRGLLRLVKTVEDFTGMQNLYSPGFRRLIRTLPQDTDVVHLHSLWGSGKFADLAGIQIVSSRLPTVLTLRDEWMLTGHCACSHDCERWRIGCGKCPNLAEPPSTPRDGTRINFWRKKQIIRRSNVQITTVSRFLQRRAEESQITRNNPIRTIYNGIDTTKFSPGDRVTARRALGLDPAKKYMLLTGQTVEWAVRGKAQLAARALNELGPTSFTPLVVGKAAEVVASSLRVPCQILPFQSTVDGMVDCYRAADLTLVASEVETFGRIAAESQACGTPVITTDVGGLPEVVGEGGGGLIVRNGDLQGYVDAIRTLTENDELLRAMSINATAWVSKQFDQDKITREYLQLYREAIEAK